MKSILFTLLLCTIPLSLAAQATKYPANTWFDSLGVFENKDLLEKWHSTKAYTKIANPEYPDRMFHTFTEEGYILEYKGLEDKLGLSTIIFGTQKGFKDFKPGNGITIDSYKKELPLGLKFGMSRKGLGELAGQPIDGHSGGVHLRHIHAIRYGTNMYEFLHLPLFGNVNVYTQFVDDKLEIVVLEFDPGPGSFPADRFADKTTYDLSQTVGERIKMDKKYKPVILTSLLDHLLKSNSPESFYDLSFGYPAIKEPYAYRKPKEKTVPLSWCIDGIKDPGILFTSTLDYLGLTLNPRYRFGLYSEFVISDYKSEKISDTESIYFHVNDQYSYKYNNDSLLFHAYYLEDHQQIVVNTYFPEPYVKDQPRRIFEKRTYRNCTENTSSTPSSEQETPSDLSEDEDTLELVTQNLKDQFDDFPGNYWLSLIGTNLEDAPRQKGMDLLRYIDGDEVIIRGIALNYLSKKESFKEKAPFGLKRNAKLQDVKKVFRNIEPEVLDEGDGFYTYRYRWAIRGDVHIQIELSFNEKERLYHASMRVQDPLPKEWLLLRNKIFPAKPR